eukprot:gene1017-9922_t
MWNWFVGLFGGCTNPTIRTGTRDAIQYANEQLEVEVDAEKSLELTIAKFTAAYSEQSQKEKILNDCRNQLEEKYKKMGVENSEVEYKLKIELPMILNQIRDKMIVYEEKIKYLEEQLQTIREQRIITEEQKYNLQKQLEDNTTQDDVRSDVMSNITTEHSSITFELKESNEVEEEAPIFNGDEIDSKKEEKSKLLSQNEEQEIEI